MRLTAFRSCSFSRLWIETRRGYAGDFVGSPSKIRTHAKQLFEINVLRIFSVAACPRAVNHVDDQAFAKPRRAPPAPHASPASDLSGVRQEKPRRNGAVARKPLRFDEDTNVMRARPGATSSSLPKPELAPPGKARGIVNGVLLDAVLWATIIALGVAIWHRLNS
jgi:hypothetical protein